MIGYLKGFMAKKNSNDVWNFLFAVGAIVGGGIVLNEWLKGKKFGEQYYKCPKCKYDVLAHGQTPCPNCGQTLTYDN